MGSGEAPGRWLSDPETLERLGVMSAGPLEGPAFVALMEGRHPGTGGGCAKPARTVPGVEGSM